MEKWIFKITEPTLDNDTCLFHEALFSNANGYLGVRACFEEGYPKGYDSIRGTYLNGFYDLVDVRHAEKLYGFIDEKQTMLNIADTQGIEIFLDGERFNLFEGEVLANERYLNLRAGVTGRLITWRSPQGKEARIEIKRLVSHALLNIFIIQCSIVPLNFSAEIKFVSSHNGLVQNYFNLSDPRVSPDQQNYLVPRLAEIIDGVSTLVTDTTRSGLSICSSVQNVVATALDKKFETILTDHKAVSEITLSGTEGEAIVMVKYASFADSLRYADCHKASLDALKQAVQKPLAYWYEKQREILADFWDKTDLEIKGDSELDLALRYNIYQLFQSAGRDKYSNVSAKGLSGEGYEGHYFWDSEIYIQPFFILNYPEIAKNLLSYRYGILDDAREHAKIMGHGKGALYPWRTISGRECSGYYPSGSAQYHINGAIAWSTLLYYFATGDFDFMVEKGAEILLETARLWLDVGHYLDNKFHIYAVSGPDEYTCVVNDNFYTNLTAKNNLAWAAKIYHKLEKEGKALALAKKIGLNETEIEDFAKAAESMYLPYDARLEIHAQDESFLQKPLWDLENTPQDKFPLLLHYHPLYLYRHQVCKQADTILAYFLFGHLLDEETMRRSFDYYEKITTHDSSLSACIFSIVAAGLGMADKASFYFGDSAKLDLYNTHGNTKDGLHIANLGGSYMAVVYGFAGLRLNEDSLSFAPMLPQGWQGYSFKVTYRGSRIAVDVSEGKCRFTLVSGPETSIVLRSDPEKIIPISAEGVSVGI